MLYTQLDYPQELGTKDANGQVRTISMYGCALVSVASMLANVFNKKDHNGNLINPLSLNQALISINGYASNGNGDFDLLKWGSISELFPSISLAFDLTYYNPPAGTGLPANLQILDRMLSKGLSVIVGVSFNHNPKEPTPTHYVEIYRKNEDGTYQMRDPMFRGEECDTVFDKRYAVNGMSVANCILQMIGYDGEIVNQQDVKTLPNAYYKIGDTIHVDAGVPTGATPDAISFSYGQISPIAPARVIGYKLFNNQGYYDVDQSAIGGGTGFALQETVDAHAVKPQPEPASQPLNNNVEQPEVNGVEESTVSESTPTISDVPTTPETTAPEMTSDQKIEQLTTEKNELAVKLQDLNTKYKTDLEAYTGIVALGYTKADDILKKLEEVANENTGLKKQLVQVLRRNKAYHLDMAEKEEEDATAIEVGMKFEYEFNKLKGDLSSIAKVFRTTPTVKAIVAAAYNIRDAYDLVVKQLKRKQTKEAAQTAVQIAESIPTQESENTLSLLSRLLTFKF